MIGARPAGWRFVRMSRERYNILGHYRHDKCQTLHDGSSTYYVIPCIPLSVTLIAFQGHSSVKQL